MGTPSTEASEAWMSLVELGGIEVDGRDEPFVEHLRVAINPEAPTIDDALSTCSIDDFARVFFRSVEEYVQMVRRLLRYFERAGARRGQTQWVLSISKDLGLELEHFREWLRSFHEVAGGIEVPDLDLRDLYQVLEMLRSSPPVAHAMATAVDRASTSYPIPPELADWLKRYRDGTYPPLPGALRASDSPDSLELVAHLAIAFSSIVTAHFDSRANLKQAWSAETDSDMFALSAVVQYETDWFLGQLVAAAFLALNLPEDDRAALRSHLDGFLAGAPRRDVSVRYRREQLESVVSLPVWKKRHELYAAWVSTVIFDALDDHEVELHHDGGKIAFEFRETQLATVLSATPSCIVVGERRVPLKSPRGKGRKAAVQPDYGVWRREPEGDVCCVIVECKHYKRSARSSFAAVLNDYAQAHPNATIFLVNHGSVGRAEEDVEAQHSGRCHALGGFKPNASDAIHSLKSAVREAVGDPVVAVDRIAPDAQGVVAIDISGSMDAIDLDWRVTRVAEAIRRLEPDALATLDVRIREVRPTSEAVLHELLGSRGVGTALAAPARQLARRFGRGLLFTDSDGALELESFATEVSTDEDREKGLRVFEIRAPDSSHE